LAEGPGVQAGKTLDGAKIIDVAPTILHLLGVPVPEDMDGRALVEILEGEAAGDVAIGAAANGASDFNASSEGDYTADDKVVIAERLRALGYID
jgi:arylsulfatase A-like enzyme